MSMITTAPARAASVTTEAARIERVRCQLSFVPLRQPASDAKVFTGRQKPLDQVAVLLAWIQTSDGGDGFGLSYSKRAGGPALFAHAREIAGELLGEDPSDTGRLWEKLQWAGASVGRGGLAIQAIAAFDVALWDLKARRAGLPLGELLDNAEAALARGVGGIKLKVGHPDAAVDLERVDAARKRLGDRVPLM